jgi:pyruvate/2-oxoglutarate dehydrogenase complex dihydrolipoamide acyltransferase (E2) component
MSWLAGIFGKKTEEKKAEKTNAREEINISNTLNVSNNMLEVMGMTREQYAARVAQSKRNVAKAEILSAEMARTAAEQNATVNALKGVGKKGGPTNANLLAELEAIVANAAPAPAPAPGASRGAVNFFFPQARATAPTGRAPTRTNANVERMLAELGNGSSGGRRRSTRRRAHRRRRNTRRN